MTTVMLTSQQCAEVLRALGDETRLQILESLLVQQKCVSDLVREIGRRQPHISHHLRILRAADLVEGLREGRRVCYRISPKIERALKESGRRALEFGCCQVSFPETLLLAHTPAPSRPSARQSGKHTPAHGR